MVTQVAIREKILKEWTESQAEAIEEVENIGGKKTIQQIISWD